MPLDVPAYVTTAPTLTQGVVVRGGNNYDLSRGAVATPVTQLSPISAKPGAPTGDASRSTASTASADAMAQGQGVGSDAAGAAACGGLRHRYGAAGDSPLLVLDLPFSKHGLSAVQRQALNKLRVQPGLVVIGRASEASSAAAARTDTALGAVARQIVAGHLRSPDIRLVNTVRPLGPEGGACVGADLVEVWRKG